MSTNPRPNREEVAKREIGATDVARAQAWTLVGVFLIVIFMVPMVQWGMDRYHDAGLRSQGCREIAQAFRLGVLPRTVPDSDRNQRRDVGALRRFKVANDQMLVNIHRFEDDQRERSFLTANLVTPVQRLTTRTIGLGNEIGYPGRDGWAFFRAGVDALTGPGFLDAKQLDRRAGSGTEWVPAPEPDPRPAILEFHAYLGSRGIDLVLVPVPTKPCVHPEMLSARYPGDARPVRNPSFEKWADELSAAGVAVVDPAPLLVARKADGPQYLETDTHWTPEAMGAVAGLITKSLDLEPGAAGTRHVREEVSALGDVAANLLKLKGTGIYPEQTVTIQRVVNHDGAAWASDSEAEILLLGDSFANIYSVTNMGWGGGAGLAEQVSHLLQRPIDVISENDAGAGATRDALARALHRSDRLAGKQVVIWEFAARELAVGDWQRIDWEAIQIPEAPIAPVDLVQETTVVGRIEAISRSPRPGTVTYKDCMVQIHLVEVEGLEGTDELLLNLWGMRDNKLTESAGYAAGDRRTFRISDWEAAKLERGLAGTMRQDLDDPDFALLALDLYWAQ